MTVTGVALDGGSHWEALHCTTGNEFITQG